MPEVLAVVVALEAEARPLVERWSLERDPGHRLFPVYRNDETWLVVSGIGKPRSAAAAAYVHGRCDAASGPRAWMNVGVAGHRELPLGTVRLAHRVTEASTGRRWYPPLVIDTPCPSAGLITVDAPTNDYTGNDLYDMEAAGFHPLAARIASAELAPCVKIVSDNRTEDVGRVTLEKIEQLVAGSGDALDALAGALRELAATLPQEGPELVAAFVSRWHFTRSERHALRRMLRRWRVRIGGVPEWDGELGGCADGGEVLARLGQRLDAAPPVIGERAP